MKSSDRERTTLNPPSNIINRGTPYFVGRDPQLEQLHQEFEQTDQLAICAIAGMGGVGKTELALQYALKNQDNYPGGLCWFQVRGLDLGTQVVNFARTKLGLTIPDQLEFNQQVEYCWGHWPEGTALIVLDDVPSFSNDYKQRIQPYLPPAQSRFKVLVTSRQRPGASYRRIDLDVLSPEAALELLESLVGKERIEQELNEAQALCEWLGYLPLGLELVGRYLDIHPSLTIAKVQKRLEKKKLAARALLDPTEQGEITAQLGVAAAFELSWEDLKESPEAQQLGCRLSLFAQAPFDWSLVESCVIETDDEDDWEEEQEDLEELRDRYLVNRNLLQLTEQQTYRLHQLIREFFLTKLAQLPEADSYKESFCKTMVAVAKKIPDTPTQEIIAAVSPAIPHLVKAATVLTDWLRDEDLPWPFTGLGRFYNGQGTYDQAELCSKQCLEITRTRFGDDHPHVAISLNNLALLYDSMGSYDQAEPLYQQALELFKQRLGHHHPLVATSLNNLGLLYNSMGHYDEAEPLYQKALELFKQRLSHHHPDVATSLNNLAGLYFSMGRYDQAEPLLQQALELFKQLLGHDHPLVATSLNNLALLYSSMGRYDQAEPLLQQALELFKQLLGKDHPDVATSLNNLADLYSSMGRYDEAEPFLQQALEMRKQLLGDNHPDVATSLNNLAYLYNLMGRYDQAEPLLQQALEIRKQRLGQDHPHVATSLNNLATLYSSMGRYDEAEPFLQQALEIRKQLLGDNHPDVATSLNNLGLLYQSMGRYDQAEPLLQQALELFKQRLGHHHPDVAISLNNLAYLYSSMGRYDQAEPLYQQALEIAEQKLGSNHPDTVNIRKNLESLRNDLSQ
ncbi:MAG: tetratricopeptide repeat protein [Moorea sp. SIO3H5]|nr:tetratricopeptide repeat protein [Moorena sp. SIO3H5]